MINPQIEVLSSEEMDHRSRENRADLRSDWHIRFPADSTRDVRGGAPHRSKDADILPEGLRGRLAILRGEALIHTHFGTRESLDALNNVRSPSQQRLIFENFPLPAQPRFGAQGAPRNAIAFRVARDAIREALKRILPFKPTAAQKRVSCRNRRGSGKTGPHESSLRVTSAAARPSTRCKRR